MGTQPPGQVRLGGSVSLLSSLYFRGLFRLASFLFLFKLPFPNVGFNIRICSPNKWHLPRSRCRLRCNSSALPRLLPREFILPKSIQCQCKSTPQISLTHSRNVNRPSQCCPTSANCTGILLQNPQCANQSWNLYDNRGYFCCEKGLIGYASTTDSDGCASPGYAFQSGEVALRIVSTGIGSLPCNIVGNELMLFVGKYHQVLQLQHQRQHPRPALQPPPPPPSPRNQIRDQLLEV
jgi:hypothetical protein